MHIVKKILDETAFLLAYKYKVHINLNDLHLFKEPLTDEDGNIDKLKFEERQRKSINIITQILNVHGKEKVVRFLGRLASMEPKIQELQPWVRDHVVHAINTFLLGVYILEKVDILPLISVRFDYRFMWKLSGPTHDLGYPIEMAHNVKKTWVKEMNDILKETDAPSPVLNPETYPQNLDRLCGDIDANDLIQKRLTEWALGIDVEDYLGWLKIIKKTDHGVVSAFAQLKVIDALYYKFNPDKKEIDIVRESLNFNQKNFDLDIVSASSALFIHNIDLNYSGFSNKISLDLAPLAFLLFLCDTFQEWDRYAEERPVYSGNDFDINCTPNSISLIVPEEIESDVYAALYQRLSGLLIEVNGRVAVT